MPVKVYVANGDREEVAALLLAAADDPQDVQVQKKGGYGYIVSDALAKKLGLSEDSSSTGLKTSGDKPVETPDKGKPHSKKATKKNKEHSDGE